jgi:hypothetical protein
VANGRDCQAWGSDNSLSGFPTPGVSGVVADASSTLIIPVYISAADPSVPPVPPGNCAADCGSTDPCWRGYVYTESGYGKIWTVVAGELNGGFPSFQDAFNFAEAAAQQAADGANQDPEEYVTDVGFTVVQDQDPNGPLCELQNLGCPSGYAYNPLGEDCEPICPTGFFSGTPGGGVCYPNVPFIPPPPPCTRCPPGEYKGTNQDTDNGCQPGDSIDSNFNGATCPDGNFGYCCVPAAPPPPPPGQCPQTLACDGVTPYQETPAPCSSSQRYDRASGCCAPCCCAVNQVNV